MGLLGLEWRSRPDLLQALHHRPGQFSTIALPGRLSERVYLVCGDMIEALDLAILLDALEQHMRAEHIVLREDVGVAEAQVHVCMRREMENRVDVVLLQAFYHVARYGNIAMKEAEIRLRLQHARIVQRAAIVELVERHDVVGVGIFDGKVAYKPRPTVCIFGAVSVIWLRRNRDFSAVIRRA